MVLLDHFPPTFQMHSREVTFQLSHTIKPAVRSPYRFLNHPLGNSWSKLLSLLTPPYIFFPSFIMALSFVFMFYVHL